MADTTNDDVIISGVSCRLPKSKNMREFKDNLMNGVDMVTDDGTRWKPGLHGLPRPLGRIGDIDRFDAAFFGISPKLANCMDPQLRMLLEVTYEAIVDAGIDPVSLRGKNVGVYTAISCAEFFQGLAKIPDTSDGYALGGSSRTMFANRISYCFDFKGPSNTFDTACSTGLSALHFAVNNIRHGDCEAAIVCGANLCLSAIAQVQFLNAGLLSPDGRCKSFDASGNGYVRSEGIVALYIQKSNQDPRRIYCSVVNTGTNCDGYKEQGISYPSSTMQREVLNKVYKEANINPADVDYVEAHGTGTAVGDPIEANVITDFFCNKRSDALKIGSLKSNIGHGESVSGLSSIAKVIVAMEEGILPANLHLNTPNPEILGIKDGRLKVITKNTPWTPGLVGINSFGFGGSNVHVILKPNTNANVPKQANTMAKRLVVACSQTSAGLEDVLQCASTTTEEFRLLMNETILSYPTNTPYRGYTVLNGTEKEIVTQKRKKENRPVWYVFAGMGSQWPGMGKQMMELDVFRESILKSENILKQFNFNLVDIITDDHADIFSSVLNSFVSIIAIQIALVDVLSSMNIRPDGILGHSVGELACAYADGCHTAEEIILLAYWRGYYIQEANLPPGAMAAVGLTWKECASRCPAGVVPACHNSQDLVTVSGPADKVRWYVDKLKLAQVYAKEISSSNIAFHSYFMKEVEQTLLEKFKTVIPSPKHRSHRWISSSIPADKKDTPLAKLCSAEYHVNNVVNPVLFYEALLHVPKEAIVIEIAPTSLLQASIKRTVPTDCYITGMMKANHPDLVQYCLSSIGDCFNQGLNLNACAMVSDKSFPVPRGTPMLSPLIQWDHSETWDDGQNKSTKEDGCDWDIDISPGSEFEFLSGHIFDGRIIIPAAAYLILVWKTWAQINNQQPEDTIIALRDMTLHNAVVIPNHGRTTLSIRILRSSMKFEITNGDSHVAKGSLEHPDEEGPSFDTLLTEPWDENDVMYELTHDDVYKELHLLGQTFEGEFKNIRGLKVTRKLTRGTITWTGHWISFLDNMLQCMLFPSVVYKHKFIPQNVDYFYVNPKEHMRKIVNGEITVQFKEWSAYVRAGGLVVYHHKSRTMPRKATGQKTKLQEYKWTPYGTIADLPTSQNTLDYAKKCSDLALGCLENWIAEKNELSSDFEAAIKRANGSRPLRIPEPEATELVETAEHGLYKGLAMKFENQKKKSIVYPLESLEQDIVYSCLTNSGCIDIFLDTVCENLQTTELPITELCQPTLKSQIELRLEQKYGLRFTYKTAKIDSKIKHVGEEEMFLPLDVEHKTIGKRTYLLVSDNVLHRQANLSLALSNMHDCLMEGGFVLIKETTRNFHIQLTLDITDMKTKGITDADKRTCSMYCDSETWRKIFSEAGFDVVMQQSDPFLFTMFLLRRRRVTGIDKQWVVDVTGLQYGWVEKLKSDLARLQSKPEEEHLWLVARDYINGVVGMINCLRKEPGGERLRCVLLADPQPIGPKVVEMVRTLAVPDMVINVQGPDGTWGCYRHTPIDKDITRKVDYAFVNSMTRGDLTSLAWVESQLKYQKDKGSQLDICRVHYSALNFRDVMLAAGKLDPTAVPGDLSQDCPLGMEFSGIASDGSRIMGLVSHKGMATAVEYQQNYAWKVPEDWTLEEACTVPVAYTTAYYSLVCRANIRQGERVLIHAGSGGVGQAAIAIALSYGCEVFTTVSTEKKKQYLLSRFPKMKPENFFNSRDVSFEQGIERLTNYAGCDIILNSLADDKLVSSLRLLGKHGRFLEIGKYDLMQNTPLGMSFFMKNVSFHGILTDMLFEVNGKPNADWSRVHTWLPEGIKAGIVRPLSTTVFERDDVEAAFRYMAQGKHIGKILVKVMPDGCQSLQSVVGIPRFHCDPTKRYIVHGGLGGFGLEFTKWLAERGAKFITVTSRSGIKNGYQRRMIHHMREDGVDFIVSNANLSKLEDVRTLLSSSEQPIGGVFNLAMVLEDGLLMNQSTKTFQAACEPKVDATINLDKITRDVCKESCDWFVCFSSASSGLGNKGQSNYGFANSTMERICERRKTDNLHGLAIQWGAIGDVGVVYETFGGNDAIIGGTIPQSLPSCLAALEMFLMQPYPVVSSHIPADHNQTVEKTSKGNDLANIVNRILGITEHHSVKDDVMLGDIGLDSLMAVEIQQGFERILDIRLHTNAIRHLTLQDVKRMSEEGAVAMDNPQHRSRELEEFIRLEDIIMPSPLVLTLNNVQDSSKTPLYVIHTLEGVIGRMVIMAEQLDCPVYGIQCTLDVPLDSVQQMSKYYIDTITEHNKNEKFHLCGFSYGSCVAVEMALQMEQLGLGDKLGCLVLLDGSHRTIRIQGEYNLRKFAHTGITNEVLAFHFFIHLFAIKESKLRVDQFLSVPSWDEKVDIVLNVVKEVYPDIAEPSLRLAINRLVQRLYISLLYEPKATQNRSVLLVKCERELVQVGLLPADYGLSETFLGDIKIHAIHGTHIDFFDNIKDDFVNIIQDYLNAN